MTNIALTLSDTDDSEEKHSIQCSPQKKRKLKNKKSPTKNISLVASKKELHDEGREQEKENIANEINGDTDDDVEYVDEKEKKSELAKYVWKLKKKGLQYKIKWSINKHARPYRKGSHICTICTKK